MTELHRVAKFNHNIYDVQNLIIDIEAYPEFLPWCSAARIIEENEHQLIADLVISYKAFTEHYRSQVNIAHPDDEGYASVNVSMISGPFKYLKNDWKLKKIDESMTEVDFYISFEFKSIMLEKLIGMMFANTCDKMMKAFEDRADQLYGGTNGP